MTWTNPRSRARILGLAACSLLCLLGCGEPKGKLSGIVTYKDKKVTAGQVSIMNPEKGVPFTAEIDGEGRFTLTNLPYGHYKVTVVQLPSNYKSPAERTRDAREKMIATKKDGKVTLDPDLMKADDAAKSLLPRVYADLATSPLKVTVDQAEVSTELKLAD